VKHTNKQTNQHFLQPLLKTFYTGGVDNSLQFDVRPYVSFLLRHINKTKLVYNHVKTTMLISWNIICIVWKPLSRIWPMN